MPMLLDAALAVLVLSGAIFLGAVGLALFKALKEEKDENTKKPN